MIIYKLMDCLFINAGKLNKKRYNCYCLEGKFMGKWIRLGISGVVAGII